jgi:beta-fructofuranosidase
MDTMKTKNAKAFSYGGKFVNKLHTAIESVIKEQPKVNKNYWRLNYHVSTPAYWMNDPNGFSFFNGEYHLFYQHHPYSPEWGPMFWGHVKSKNLVHWEHMPIALAPTDEYDQDGCFSGGGIEKDGSMYVMYTGNTWTGDDHDKDLLQVQCLAVSDDGIHFTKFKENPVIAEAPTGDVHPYHIRDPKVWKQGNDYYCVLGSRTMDHHGQVLLYRSSDLLHWEFISVMAKSDGDLGYMWECPDVFRLEGHDVLMMSPQGVKPKGDLYHNLHQAGYVLGELDYHTGVLSHGDFHLLDYGFDFYAPQTMEDPKGRRIMIAWMAMWESHMPEQEYNWAGAMTIPRQLEWMDGEIYSKPVQELKELRGNVVRLEHVTVKEKKVIPEVIGDCYELEVTIDAKSAEQFGVKVRVSEKEETVISYSRLEGKVILDRERSGKGPKGIRKAPVQLKENLLHLRVFVDHSSVEVFINEGEKVMSARVYPSENSTGISFFSDEEISIVSLQKWDLKKCIHPLSDNFA